MITQQPTTDELRQFMLEQVAQPEHMEVEVNEDWIIFRVYEPPMVVRIPLYPDMISYLTSWQGPYIVPRPTLITTWAPNEPIDPGDIF